MKNAPGGDRKKKQLEIYFCFTTQCLMYELMMSSYGTKQNKKKEYLKKKKKIQNFHGPFKVVIFDEYKSTRFPTLFLSFFYD